MTFEVGEKNSVFYIVFAHEGKTCLYLVDYKYVQPVRALVELETFDRSAVSGIDVALKIAKKILYVGGGEVGLTDALAIVLETLLRRGCDGYLVSNLAGLLGVKRQDVRSAALKLAASGKVVVEKIRKGRTTHLSVRPTGCGQP
ncbi:MAG: hypothetical protein QXP36_09710 [Conexivisphaerales archaeon]